jgi:hypothetical protein
MVGTTVTLISIGYKALIGLASCALSLTAVAGELTVHTISRHSQYNQDVGNILAYNNQNFGLGWRTENGLIFGAYHNSYYRPTVYLGQEFMLNRYFGTFAGLATGYRHPISAIGGLILKIPVTERAAMEFMGAPRIGRIDGVIHVAASYRF